MNECLVCKETVFEAYVEDLLHGEIIHFSDCFDGVREDAYDKRRIDRGV